MTESRDLELAHAAAMPAPMGGALPTSLEWQALERMATMLAGSDLIPYKLKRKPGDVAVVLLAAREYGIPPLMALSKLPVVNGTPAPMGELMVALILRAGHRITADFKNPDGTRYKGGQITREHYGEAVYRRRDWDADESATFTIEEAIAAGLVTLNRDGKPEAYDDKNRPLPWMLYTPNMARWRAVANAARLNFPDVLLGLSYLPEELGAIVDADGRPIEGELVDEAPRRTAPPQQTQEAAEAQATADRLVEFHGPAEVLDNVTAHAATNGYLRERVTYRGDAMTLEGAIAVRRAELADTVDGDVVEEQAPAETAQNAPEEAPAPPPAPEEAPTPETAPQEAASVIAAGNAANALEYARAVLEEGSLEALREMWKMAGDLLTEDVTAVVGDDDLAALGVDPREAPERIQLGGLIMQARAYVERHGIAIRDLGLDEPAVGEAPPATEDPVDPWAADAAAGWPAQGTGPQ